MNQRGLSMWTIYDHPLDYPDCWIVRRHFVTAEGSTPTNEVMRFASLELARLVMTRKGLACLTRSPDDDPRIVETWF